MLADLIALQGSMKTQSQEPRINVAKPYERMNAAYNAIPETGLISTPEIAAIIGATVHQTTRALDRLAENGKIHKIKLQLKNLNHWKKV